jgi:hypothetical protein
MSQLHPDIVTSGWGLGLRQLRERYLPVHVAGSTPYSAFYLMPPGTKTRPNLVIVAIFDRQPWLHFAPTSLMLGHFNEGFLYPLGRSTRYGNGF